MSRFTASVLIKMSGKKIIPVKRVNNYRLKELILVNLVAYYYLFRTPIIVAYSYNSSLTIIGINTIAV